MTRHVLLFRDRSDGTEESGQTRRHSSIDEERLLSSVTLQPPLSRNTDKPHSLPPPSADPYEWLLTQAGFTSTSIPVLKYDYVNLDSLALELADHRNFHG